LFLVSVKQNHLLFFYNDIKNPVRTDFDFPELSLNLPKLNANSIQPPSFHLLKRFKDSCAFRLGKTLYILQQGDLPEAPLKSVTLTVRV
jgi:hypothetical protein